MILSELDNEILEKKKRKVLNILLVEDNEGDIRLTKEALKESNFDSVLNVVRDGVDAIDYLKRNGNYNLILLDLNLPKVNGTEVLSVIKNDYNLKSIPVIVLTTSSSNIDILNTYNEYANCFITKPVDFDQFIYIIKCIEEFWVDIVNLPIPS